ncbi:MAG TPA: hypothetical protein VF055_02945, partial [Steroidobacteraceae bacterium]
LATHYGCFQLTDEGIDEPVRELSISRRAQDVPEDRFVALTPGGTLHVPAASGRKAASGE